MPFNLEQLVRNHRADVVSDLELRIALRVLVPKSNLASFFYLDRGWQIEPVAH
jgi:hypothetical protein